MNDDSFSLKARRTTRIPLRIPIVLVFREDGAEKERSIDAWTLIVNVNGARIECKQLFQSGQEVTLRVPHLGKSQKGAVIWRDANANKNGGYECGIKLEKAENLWGVGFPPSDWTTKASGIDDLLPSKVEPAPAPAAEATQNGTEQYQMNQTGCSGAQQESAAQAVPAEPAIPAEKATSVGESETEYEQVRAYQGVDLTQDLTAAAAPETVNRTLELFARAEPSGSEELGLKAADLLPEFSVAAQATQESLRSGSMQEALLQELPAAPALTASVGSVAGANTPSDRLSTIFHELVESALQQRLHGLVEGLAGRMEMRIAQIETAAVTQVEERVARMVQSQSDLLEGRAAEIVSSRQAAMEEGVRTYLEGQEETARRAQQEMMQETFRVMCEEVGQTAASSRERVAEQAEEIVSATRTNLWQSVQRELPGLEQEVLARGKAQAEQSVAGCFDEVNRRLPERIREAEQSVNQQMDRVAEERLDLFTASLTERSEQLQTESRVRMEQQIQEVWRQASQAFLRHIVSELNQKKQTWLQEAEGNLQRLSDQNLSWTRRRTTQFLKNLGTSLIEQAREEDAGSEQAAERFDEQKEPEMSHLVEAHAGE